MFAFASTYKEMLSCMDIVRVQILWNLSIINICCRICFYKVLDARSSFQLSTNGELTPVGLLENVGQLDRLVYAILSLIFHMN